ncbi:MAG: phosphoribosylformylglycinamidine synthase subunit PurL [Gemmataceae bacterium]|nr:phosphoribosylformylglycinamidine synthase subunit PurL [Gemmataceae bacterium]
MIWEIEILPRLRDPERERVLTEYGLLAGPQRRDRDLAEFALTARGFLVEGIFPLESAQRLLDALLLDPLAEWGRVGELNALQSFEHPSGVTALAFATVLLKPGVMDPVAESVELAARDLGIDLFSVRTFRRYYAAQPMPAPVRDLLFRKILANEAIEQAIEGPLLLDHLTLGSEYTFQLVTVPIRNLDDDALLTLSRSGQLSLNRAEMRAIQEHYRKMDRDPTDVELETLAQTWSEHCSHKTLKGHIEFNGRLIRNLLKETIFGATQEIRSRLGPNDWCVSVFEDNAGVVRFDDNYHVCFKVETHNHPSAIEPYGGANTGLGGVIRDPLGTGLGAKPICNTDVFCFAPPDTPSDALPPGVLHPRKVMTGVVSGVRDYGNRMGIPTINGAVCFDPRYIGNPLVYCGTVGLIPVQRAQKAAQPGDLIVAVGGRTGRDGIHGATFSSIELSHESESVSGGAVQIGNAITEKKLLDVIVQARDRGLYSAITDCGAGGFSSAIGEMGEKVGAEVHLERAPLKYQGLSYTEIWISEAQERMILAVPPRKWDMLRLLCQSEDVEATALGTFEPTGKLRLFYKDKQVAEIDMEFLHEGRPQVVRKATWRAEANPLPHGLGSDNVVRADQFSAVLHAILSSPNVCSKEWIIRQYDHEVQGGSVVKPLVGAANDGPSDAAVVLPVLGSWRGIAVGCGINPHYGDLDPYHMAALAIDEAVRNVVAVGADPKRIALLDNFCWGNTERPEVLGSLVRAAEACRDVALAYMMPFISGKDSLNNEFRTPGRTIAIPPTLLISALGIVPDVRRCVTMDLKEAGNAFFLVGETKNELGGSHYELVTGQAGGDVPNVNTALAPRLFAKLHEAIERGLVRSCHDLSEGGLATALAEMAFAGNIGVDVTSLGVGPSDVVLLFSESPTRFVLEVRPDHIEELSNLFDGLPCRRLGQTVKEARLRIAGANGEWLIWTPLAELKESWQKTLRW